MADKTLTFVLMDPPYESDRTTTAMRLMHIAASRGYNINVFAYEGAVYLATKGQQPHANAVHGRDVDQENHPVMKDWVVSLIQTAEQNGGRVDWVNCGLCVDERGAQDFVPSTRRGSPADLVTFAENSVNTLVIPVK